MLHIKMFISNAAQEIIQTNKNGEFAGHMQIKLLCVQRSLAVVWSYHCMLAVFHSYLKYVEPEHCVVKIRITYQDLTNHRVSQNRNIGF